jgi:uncharacterized protein
MDPANDFPEPRAGARRDRAPRGRHPPWGRDPAHGREAGSSGTHCLGAPLGEMPTASDLMQRHVETLVADNPQWQTLIADDLVWELPYAPALGHPARLSGRDEVLNHIAWFLKAVEHFRFYDLRLQAMADPSAAVVEVRAEAVVKATGRPYHQDYVIFLRAAGGKIAFLREYFNPARAAQAFDIPIHALAPEKQPGRE